MINLKDFIGVSPVIPANCLKYDKILAISDVDFADFYLQLMTVYKEKDGWWGKQGVPKCWTCHEEIESPKDLRRYCGQSHHPVCFGEMWKKERKTQKWVEMRKYFDRVAKLRI